MNEFLTSNLIEKDINVFSGYPDVVNVKQLREMLGGISRALAYRLLNQQIIINVRIGREYKILKNNVIDFFLNESSKTTPHNDER